MMREANGRKGSESMGLPISNGDRKRQVANAAEAAPAR